MKRLTLTLLMSAAVLGMDARTNDSVFECCDNQNAQEFPVLKTGKANLDKAFTLAVETLFKNTPDSLIKAGGAYGGEWTRDVSINSWNAAALLMPEKTAYSLWSVTTDNRTFIGHQYWDHIIWVTGAFDSLRKPATETSCIRLTLHRPTR